RARPGPRPPAQRHQAGGLPRRYRPLHGPRGARRPFGRRFGVARHLAPHLAHRAAARYRRPARRRPVRRHPRLGGGRAPDRGDRDLSLTASIGVTIYDGNPVGAADVLRDAELAMYYAKRLGGDRIEAYRASARSIAAYTRASEEDLDRGLRHGELQVQFQPIMDIHHGVIAGCEALMRWNHPQRGMVPPEEFVPLAERTGLIERLGRLAFEQAAGQAREWVN